MMDTGRMTEYKEKGIYKGHGGRQEGGQHTHRYCEGRKEGRHIKNMEGRKEDNTHTQDTIREGKKEGPHGKHGSQEGGQHTHKIPSGKERRAYVENMEDRKEASTHMKYCQRRKEGRHMENTEVRKEDNTHAHVVRKGKKEDTHGKHGKKTSIYRGRQKRKKTGMWSTGRK